MSPVAESTVEDAVLSWLSELGYDVRHGQEIAPGMPAAQRDVLLPKLLSGEIRVVSSGQRGQELSLGSE